MAEDYAGDLTPEEAWGLLEQDHAAQLVDVRSLAEWRHVGLPDLQSLGKQVHCVSWQLFPAMNPNPDFAGELAAAGDADPGGARRILGAPRCRWRALRPYAPGGVLLRLHPADQP